MKDKQIGEYFFPQSEKEKMEEKLSSMSDEDVLYEWDCLKGYNMSEMYAPDIPMHEWAMAVKKHLEMRKI